MNTVLGLLVLVLAGNLLSCSGHKSAALSLIPAPAKPPESNAETLRKAQLQLIQYYDYDTQSYKTDDAGFIQNLVVNECSNQLGFPASDLGLDLVDYDWCVFSDNSLENTPIPADSSCHFRVCTSATQLCAANMLKKLATEPGTVLTMFNGRSTPHVRVEPQSTGANAALMVMATYSATTAQANAVDALDSMTFDHPMAISTFFLGKADCTDAEADLVRPRNGSQTTLGSIAANVFVESSQVAEELSSSAADTILASADAELSSSLSETLVQQRAIAGSSLSRSQAVRILMGETAGASYGYTGLEGLPGSSLCTTSELSSQAARALQLLREAAPSPADVLGTNSIQDFLDLDRASGSIKQRLAAKWGRTLDGSLVDSMKLNAQDFGDAREYLKQELTVFARSKTQTYETAIGPYARYASTATEPQDRDPAYWAAVARFHDQGQADPGALNNVEFVPTSFADNRYQAVREANLIAKYSSNLDPSVQSVGDQMSLLGSTLQARALGFVRFNVNPQATVIVIEMDSVPTPEPMRLIFGDDGLSCATQGNIDGVACSLTQLDDASKYEWTPVAYQTANVLRLGAPTTDRVYIVRSKNGGRGPGDYASLLGASPTVFSPAELAFNNIEAAPTTFSKSWPIAPDVDRKVAEILKPNKHSCSRPRISCAGTTFDERMPLENELSSDQDPVESSWRHYLDLAKAAATTADQLGGELITSQLNVDLRSETVEQKQEARNQDAEAAIDDLQQACGTNVDPMQLLLALSGSSDPKDLSNIRQHDTNGATIDCSSNAACSGGYACLNGVCMKNALDPAAVLASTSDPALKQALSRINECIGSDTTAPFVSLGTLPVCVWYPNGIPSQVCKSSSASIPCPVFATTSDGSTYSCASMKLPTDFDRTTNTEVKLVDRQLGYFTSPAEPAASAQVCENLKSARRFSDPGPLLTQAIATQIFHPYNLRQLAPRIGWSASLAGNATVTLDGHALYGPRDPAFGPSGRLGWCESCATDGDWATLDDRSLRAVVALRGTTGVTPDNVHEASSLRDIQLPFYLETKAVDSLKDGATWTMTYPGTNIPIQVHQRQWVNDVPVPGMRFPEDDYVENATGPTFNQFHVDSSTALPASWRTPASPWIAKIGGFGNSCCNHGTPVEWPASLSINGRSYEFAIGEAGLTADDRYYYKNNAQHSFPNGRMNWWGRMSASAIAASYGGVWDSYTQSNDFGVNFAPAAVFLPGAPFAAESNGSDGSFINFQTVGQCQDPDDPKPVSSYDSATGCAYHVIQIVPPFQYTKDALLDAAELVCAVSREVAEYKCDFAHPPTIEHPQDYAKAKAFLECGAREIQRKAGQTVLAGFPERAVDALRAVSSTGAYPAVGGTVGEDISHLRGALVQLAAIQGRLAYQMQSLGNDFETLSAALSKATIKDEVADTQFQSATSNQLTACAQAMSGVSTLDFVSIPGRIGGAAMECANAFAQIQFAGTLDNLTKGDSQLDRRQSVTEFRQRFADRALAFQGFAEDLGTQLEEIDARLASIEKNQQLARQALGRALYKASAVASSEATVTTVQGNIAAVAQERYQRANKNAVRLAFLAKRAIENRLGVRLSSMRSDLPLVEAPVTWEASVCASTGVDYTALKKNVSAFQANTFADQFIGDYVSKLENVVESYRLANDFHEGDDTSIVSLRDDIFNVRAQCDTPSRNLITLSGQQSVLTNGSEAAWLAAGCSGDTSCVPVRKAPEVQGPGRDGELPSAGVFGLTFAAGTSLRKAISIPAGQYVLSWYSSTSGGASARVNLVDASGALVDPHSFAAHTTPASNGFTRFVAPYNLTANVDGWLSVTSGETTEVLFAAPMLEARGDTVASAYEDVSASGTHHSMDCPDTTGETFRRTRWNHKCEQLCSNGFADSCDGNAATSQCFWETSFAINQRGIESGDILNLAGFAKGNFNYRLSDVGLNFIGTGIQTCASSPSPQTCASSGNLQYSLVHAGPYYVRNHDGADARIQLFEGHIEHARGLAAERFLTNPLSSTDSELLNQYMRTEFRGRPLDGNFTLRVWDKPGENFDAIQDIQLVLKYRYWTRFQ